LYCSGCRIPAKAMQGVKLAELMEKIRGNTQKRKMFVARVSKSKVIRGLYGGINEFKKCYQGLFPWG